MKKNLLRLSLILSVVIISCYFLVSQLENNEVNSIEKNNVTIQPEENNVKTDDIKVEEEKQINQVVNKTNQLVSVETKIRQQGSNRYSKNELDSIKKVREKYHKLVNYHPLRAKMRLPKAERKAMGLPPNAFNEQEWLYTANPNLGYPTPEVTLNLQKELNQQIETGRVPGDGMDNQWIERGQIMWVEEPEL